MTPTTDRVEAIRDTLTIFLAPGQVTELRALQLGTRKALNAFFSTERVGDMARQAIRWEREGAKSVRFIPNPLRPDVADSPRFARNDDVVGRRWLMVDCEGRTHAEDRPASDLEREAAWAVLDRCRGTLDAAGFRGAVVGDSGNYWHLFYPLDLPNDESSRELVKALLKGLAQRCSDDQAHVDPGTYHAMQLAKVYGTLSRKGVEAPGCPHRFSRLVEGQSPPSGVAEANGTAARRLLDRWKVQDDLRRGPERQPLSAAQREDARLGLYAQSALSGECGKVAGATPGTRNRQLNDSAFALGTLVGAGLLPRDVAERDLAGAAGRCGLPPQEARGTIRSGLNAGARQPRPRPEGNGRSGANPSRAVAESLARERRLPRPVAPYRPFPVNTLPGPAAALVNESAASIGCDPAYVALPVLTVLATAVGNTRAIRLKRRWLEPAVLWTATVGESGTQKTPGWKDATEHVFRVQRHWLRQHRQALRDWRQQGEEGEQPSCRRVVTSNTTVEKLARLLGDNPRGLLMARDELNGWLTSFSRYKGPGGGTDLPDWLEMHRAGCLVIDRKTGDVPTLAVHPAAVNVCGTIQPGTLSRALTAEYMDAGLGARLLLAMPPRRPKRWSETEVSPETVNAYERLLDALFTLEPETPPGEDETAPVALGLDSAAKLAWIRFYNSWADEQAAAEGELASAFAKIEAYAARLALVHHVATLADYGTPAARAPVSVGSMDAGIEMALWFAEEARRVYAVLGESEEERRARELFEYVRARGGRTTVRDLQRANSRRYRTAEDAEGALQALVDAGLADWEEQPPPSHGGHPMRHFLLRPTHDTSDTRTPGGGGSGEDRRADTRSPGADTPPDAPQNSADSASTVGSVMRRMERNGSNPGGGDGPPSPPGDGQVSDGPENHVSDDPCPESPF